jgi:RNA polymerase sigma-70 factor (ECF subfamily)
MLVGAEEVSALAELFDRHRGRLRQMIRLRLGRRLHVRVDPPDILQDAYVDLAAKLRECARRPGPDLPLAQTGRR